MTGSADEPSRLAEAIDAFLARPDAPTESDTVYLARHPQLRDLLEPMLDDAAGDDAPSQVGPYRILGELGRGGMGVVYEAEHAALHRAVALKILPSGLAAWPRRVERFLREAVAVAKLDHPGIVRVFDAGEAQGVFYYAMERVDGGSLRAALDAIKQRCLGEPRRLADQPQIGLPGCSTRIDEVAALGVGVAEALAHAHAQGIVHRDVKPQNLLLGVDRQPRLVDFGLVKDLDTLAPASVEFAGTPQYASPEQIDPTRSPLDGRCDVFGLGVVLYELACLRRPFDGASTESVLRAVLQEEPRSLRSFDPRISRDFEAIVLQALEKDPRARYPSARALADDLRRLRDGAPVRARRRSWARATWRWVWRNPAPALASLLALLLVVGGPSAALWFTTRSSAEIAAERDVARASFKVARRVVDELLEGFTDEDLAESPQVRRLRVKVLRDAGQGYADLLRIQGAPVDPSLSLAAMRNALAEARTLNAFTRRNEAAARFGTAIALSRDPAVIDQFEARIVRATALGGRSVAHFLDGHFEKGMFDAANSRLEWCELRSRYGRDPRYRSQLAEGEIYAELRLADVVRPYDVPAAQQALGRAETLAADHEPATATQVELQLLAAEIAQSIGDIPRARRAAEAAATIIRHSEQQAPLRTPRQRVIETRLAHVRASLGADQDYRQLLTTRNQLVRDLPDFPQHRLQLVVALNNFSRRQTTALRAREAAELAEQSIALASDLAAEAASVEHLLQLARSYVSLSAALIVTHSPEDLDLATGLLGESQRLLEICLHDSPDNVDVRSELGATLSNRAQVIAIQNSDTKVDREVGTRAADLLQRAIAEQAMAMSKAPESVSCRDHMTKHLLLLGWAEFKRDDYVAAEAALERGRHRATHANDLIRFARGLMYCARRNKSDARTAALDTLARARQLGHGDKLRALGEDPAFADMRTDPRFLELTNPAPDAKR